MTENDFDRGVGWGQQEGTCESDSGAGRGGGTSRHRNTRTVTRVPVPKSDSNVRPSSGATPQHSGTSNLTLARGPPPSSLPPRYRVPGIGHH
jgi:hypothetical protein